MSGEVLAAKIAEYRKAIAGAVVPGLTAFGVAIADGVVTPTEWVIIALATLTGGSVVALTPNQPQVTSAADVNTGSIEIPDDELTEDVNE